MNKVRFIRRFLHYYRHALTKYHVHSPFVFELLTKVFDDKFHYPDFAKPEAIRRSMLENSSTIEVNDFGANAFSKKYVTSYKYIHQIAKNSAIQQKYGRLMYKMVKHIEPKTIIEMGTSLGISAIYLSLAAPHSKIHCLEGCSNTAEYAKKNFDSLRLKNIQLYIGNFDTVLPQVLEKVEFVDFAFIDGNHREEPTIQYFNKILPKCHNDSVLIFDDIHWSKGMENAWEYIIKHPSVTLSLDLFYMGWVFFKKEITKQDFIIRY